MKKLLYVTPHLSTGGLPQYLLKQIEFFKNKFDINVIEYNNISNDYVVQKNKIKQLVPVYTLQNNKNEIINIINKLNPDIIHFQEIPEHFVDKEILNQIFNYNRKYNIIITTHSSIVQPLNLYFIPDRYVLVSEWSKQQFLPTGVECDIWEYPIEDKSFNFNEKQIAQNNLEHFSFSEKGKHILNIGLFTPGKNQAEIIEIAKQDPENHYHFVGNMAPNFKQYWEPLLNNRSNNCYFWGEREDIDNFYKACDIFYFSSKFELNPLVVKEALSYKMFILMYKLDTYLNEYDNNISIYYLNDLKDNDKIKLINNL